MVSSDDDDELENAKSDKIVLSTDVQRVVVSPEDHVLRYCEVDGSLPVSVSGGVHELYGGGGG